MVSQCLRLSIQLSINRAYLNCSVVSNVCICAHLHMRERRIQFEVYGQMKLLLRVGGPPSKGGGPTSQGGGPTSKGGRPTYQIHGLQITHSNKNCS